MYTPSFFESFEYIGDKVVHTTIPNFYHFDDNLESRVEYDVDEFHAALMYVDPRVCAEGRTFDEKSSSFRPYAGKTMRRTKSSYVRDYRYLARKDQIPEQKIGFALRREKNRVTHREKSWYARAYKPNRDRHRNRSEMRLNCKDDSDDEIHSDSEENDEIVGPCVTCVTRNTRVITFCDFI